MRIFFSEKIQQARGDSFDVPQGRPVEFRAILKMGGVASEVEHDTERKDVPISLCVALVGRWNAMVGGRHLQAIHLTAGLNRIAGEQNPPAIPIQPIARVDKAMSGQMHGMNLRAMPEQRFPPVGRDLDRALVPADVIPG